MTRNNTVVKYNNGKAKCKCGGHFAYDASETRKLPLGFGFLGSRFQIDVRVYKGWRGECMDCGHNVFAVVSVRHETKFPKLNKAKQ